MGIKFGGIKIGGGKSMNPADIAKREVEKAVNSAMHEVEKKINDAASEVRDEINHAKEGGLYAVNTAANNGVGALEKAGKKAIEDVSDAIDDLISAALDELARALTKQGLKSFRAAAVSVRDKLRELERRRPDLHDAVDGITIWLQLGPIKMEFARFLSRADSLITTADIWIDHPPSLHRREIRTVVDTLGPDTIDLGISVNFALLIGSKELGVGCGLDKIQGELIQELLDLLLEACGVPE